jgi:cysteine desulfurase / selenocysteine lyase
MTSKTRDFKSIREDFPALKQNIHGRPLIYLDSAASTLKPQQVIDSISQHYSKETSNVHRGIHFLSSQATEKYEETRETTRTFLNASSTNEIIFTKGTTDSINLVAESWGRSQLQTGDQILISTMEHHSNIVPWQMIAEKMGASVVEIPINDQGEILEEEYKNLLNPKVKMVSMAHISNTLGTINPIKRYIEMAHNIGSLFLVDAAQSVAHMPIDVRDLDCDFLAFSGHKIYGPTGIGVLYGKEKHLDSMPPYQGGGAMIKNVSFSGTTYNDLPEKFEAGTPHIAGVICLKTAIDYTLSLGFDNLLEHENQLTLAAMSKLQEIEGVRLIGTASHKSGVVSFVMDEFHPHDIGMILDQQGVAIRTGHHCTQPLMKRFGVSATARASFGAYNSLEDIEALIAAIIKAKDLL